MTSNANKSKNVVKKNVNQEKSHIGFLLFFVVVFIVILIGTVFNDWVQIYENNKLNDDLNTYYGELQEEEASLNSEVAKLQDPDYLSRYARERYGYTKDGEKILTIVDGRVITEQDTE